MKTLTILLTALAALPAHAGTTYLLTITNGGNMPFSPGVVYSANQQPGGRTLGTAPSAGFVKLCQTGDPSTRAQELKSDMNVGNLEQTMGLIMPGESRTVEIEVARPQTQSLFFETMYGKTKDVCAVAQITSHSLVALKQHVTPEVAGRDSVVQTGAFGDPMVANGTSYLDANQCVNAATAVDCLRELSMPVRSLPRVKFFSAYMPSLVNQLEMKYGTPDVRTLIIPEAGAAQFQLKLKH